MTLLSSTGLLNQNVEGNLFRESIGGFQISPDQKRLLFQVSDPLGGDVWMHQFASGASSRITRMGDVHEKWAPLWLDTVWPGGGKRPLRRLMVAQDTGNAIKGPIRGDFFWGYGQDALAEAGRMKSRGNYYLLLPKSTEPTSS